LSLIGGSGQRLHDQCGFRRQFSFSIEVWHGA
jgi:hypothetical protein